ncbi:ArnT family glycosyltransferase [Falsochrobactrum tianjinense]|uniref:ArnT family glycosyltransferase n=1 Tax=Falsochrobactrum tianjinense TaxID=2706015 RepID=UPI0020C86C51|nr:glycosyltransferase family 39 protein [Falsochrobactrum sp. TDYN1]
MTISKSSATSLAHKTIFGLPLAVIFILCYFAFQALLVTFASNGAGLDDAEQLANISYLDWGYGGSQPPLYTWIASLATSILGTSMLTLQIVKFSILASLFLSIFAAMRLLGFSRAVASAGMLGLFLIPQIGWESQRALTHSVAGTAGCGWAFCAFAWHMRARHPVSAAALGITMVAAILGKFNASLFVVTLILTGLSIPEYRKILLSKLSIVTALAFTICIAPTGLWMLQHKSSVIARAEKLQIGVSGNLFLDRINGIESYIEAAFLFSILVAAIAGIIALIHMGKRTAPERAFTPGERFMRHIIVIGMLIVLAGVVIIGINNIKDRWLQPVLFLAPATIAGLFARYRSGSRALADFTAAGIVAALIVPPILSYYLTYGSGTPPYGQLDYQRLYAEVQTHGQFRTILTDNTQIAGNFRLFDPAIQVIHPETPAGASRVSKPVLVMWFGDAIPNERISALMAEAQVAAPAADINTTTIAYKTAPDMHFTVSYFLLK